MSLERIDDLRRRLLVAGVAISVPLSLIRYWNHPGGLWRWGAVSAFIGSLLWIAHWRADPARWKVVVPAAFSVTLAPLACGLLDADQVEASTLFLMPIVLAVLFIDAFDVVIAAAVAGWLANAAFVLTLNWPLVDTVTTLGSFGGVLAAVIMAAGGVGKLREIERVSAVEHGQALRLSESRRAQAERLAIVGRLASGVAHEINNPLAFVKSNVNALKRSASHEDELTAEELDELISDTTQGIDRICQIVADLKGFAREDSGLIEPVDLHDSVSGAVRLAMVRLPKEAKVQVNLPEDLPLVRANPRKLAQVLLNLLVNAGDALEEMRVPKPVVIITAVQEGESISLTITDNGPGIGAAAMSRLFEPFFTTKPPGKGTGLGLALSREYVEAFGGTLSAQNVTPHGAQFCISMRVSTPSSMTPLPPSSRADDGTRTFNRRRAG